MNFELSLKKITKFKLHKIIKLQQKTPTENSNLRTRTRNLRLQLKVVENPLQRDLTTRHLS